MSGPKLLKFINEMITLTKSLKGWEEGGGGLFLVQTLTTTKVEPNKVNVQKPGQNWNLSLSSLCSYDKAWEHIQIHFYLSIK